MGSNLSRRAAIQSAAGAAALSIAPAKAFRGDAPRPNVIVVCFDDATVSDMDYLPNVKALRKQAVIFARHNCAFAECAPSRSTLLLGQLPHNHGIVNNDNSYQNFIDAGYGKNNLPLWLQNSGYRTGHIGKFLNDDAPVQYGFAVQGIENYHILTPTFERYYNFSMNDNGSFDAYKAGQYATDVIGQQAVDFIDGNDGRPWFVNVWFNAPHGALTVDPQDTGTVDPATMPNATWPSYNVNIVNGVKNRQPFDAKEDAVLRSAWAERVEMMKCADRWIGQMIAALAVTGQQADVLITSDNGFQQGEHCITDSKNVLYRESARVPLYWNSGRYAANGISVPVNNCDIAATLLELTGASAGLAQDGKSLVKLLGNDNSGANTATFVSSGFQSGVVTRNYSLIVKNGKASIYELFDDKNDPYQTVNVAGESAYASILSDMQSAFAALAPCAGVSCQFTGSFPPPPGH